MSVHEDLLNNGENNCSFTEDEVDIMCSKDGDDACGMYRVDGEKREINDSRQVHFRAFQVWATFRKSSALLYENISYGCEIRKSIK